MQRMFLHASILVGVAALATACGGGSPATTSALPAIQTVAPASGGVAGGTRIVIQGANLANPQPGDYELLVGGMPAENVVVKSNTEIECDTPAHAAGAADVTLKNLYGTGTAAGAYMYYPAPTITSIDPAEGTRLGGTLVTITGSGFLDNDPGPTEVFIADKLLTNLVVVDDTTITGLTPTSWVEIAKDVTVTNHNGTAKLPNGFTYTGPTPLIYSVTPATGPAAGGTSVTISGEYFTIAAGTTRVYFGAAQASNVVRVDDQTLTCKTPAGPPFFVDVKVGNANGDSILTDGFYYIPPPPTVTGVSPNNGFVMGGENLTITGTGFVNYNPGTNTVLIGGATPTNVVIVSDTQITCKAPAHNGGATVQISVTNNNGTGTLYNAYTYIVPAVWVATGGCNGTYTIYKVDPSTMNATTIGTGSGTLSAMAFQPSTGTLYAYGDACYGGFYTINTTTGAKTQVASSWSSIGDMTFAGSNLIGYDNWGPGPCTINLSTGSTSLISNSGMYAYGDGLACDASGNNMYYSYGRSLYRVNPSTGSMTYIGSMGISSYEMCAMTFHLGELYGVDGDPWGGSQRLVKINTSNATTTNLGSLPSYIDALASQYPAIPTN